MHELMDQIRALTPTQQETLFKLSHGTETMYSGSQVIAELDLYTSWVITVGRGRTGDLGYFLGLWAHYKDMMEDQLYRIWSGMQEDYDPISNYDLTEQAADGKRNAKHKETVTPYGGTQTATQTYRAGLNSTDQGAEADHVDTTVTPISDTEHGITTKTETEYSYDNDKSMSFDGQTLTGYQDATEHYLRRYGNVGVTTNAQMLLGENDVRKIDLLADFISRFMDKHGFCVGGDDD